METNGNGMNLNDGQKLQLRKVADYYKDPEAALVLMRKHLSEKHPKIFSSNSLNPDFVRSEDKLQEVRNRNRTPKPSVAILMAKFDPDIDSKRVGCPDCKMGGNCVECHQHQPPIYENYPTLVPANS